MRRYRMDVAGREYVVDVQELGVDRFEVVVGDARYRVTLAGDEALQAPQAASLERPATVPPPAQPAEVAAPPAAPPAHPGSGELRAPMPGVILELHVKAGDVVQRGQPVAVLDAMKMHNLIGAPQAGTVIEVCVAPGQAVGHGEPIVRFGH